MDVSLERGTARFSTARQWYRDEKHRSLLRLEGVIYAPMGPPQVLGHARATGQMTTAAVGAEITPGASPLAMQFVFRRSPWLIIAIACQ